MDLYAVDKSARELAGEKGGFPAQEQQPPGLTPPMDPYPDHGEESWVGRDRLAGLKALITGGDSGIGRAVAIAYASKAPARVKGLIETAHALLAGLDPSDEMAFALAHGKLASVHLNDQNGLKYDQDKNFGAANLRAAFNQVRVLEDNDYGRNGEFIGLDVKAMRTQKGGPVTAHLKNSREIFLALVQKVRSYDRKTEAQCVEARDYEALELHVLKHLMGI